MEKLMTIGELAKKCGVSVRTLQYYHKEGILIPTAQSEGGRRLYSDKDLVILKQILSLKYLGFSLAEIRNKIIPLNSPVQVSAMLDQQKSFIKKRMESLKGVIAAIDALQEDIQQSDLVNFSRYAEIVSAMQEKWDSFWLIEKMDDKLALHTLRTFGVQDGREMSGRFQALIEQFAGLRERNMAPESTEAQAAAKKWLDMVTEFTDGDSSLLPELYHVYLNREQMFDLRWNQKWEKAECLMQESLRIYLLNHHAVHPFTEQNIKLLEEL